MLAALAISALAATLSPGALPPSAGTAPRVDLSVAVRAAPAARLSGVRGTQASDGAAPVCLGDVCQPRVSVPGLEPRYERPSRTELAAAFLDRTGVEPFATVAWLLLATGLRFEYDPPIFETASQSPSGWGRLFVRLKLRVDADNRPVIPRRHAG